MTAIDIRIIFTGYVLSILLCTIVMTSLWWQNKKRSPEIVFWLADYILQFIALLLMTFRGILPDLATIVLANLFIIGGTVVLYIGFGRFLGKESRQWHNYVMLAVFTLACLYLTYVYPDIELRTINQSMALIYICAQCSWLMLRRVDAGLLPATRAAGIVFAAFCFVSFVQIVVNLTIPKTDNLFLSGFFGVVAILIYQILFVALTFSLFMMVSRRLSTALESELMQRTRSEEQIHLNETRLMSLLNIMQHRTKTMQEFLDYALDEVIKLTDSRIGYIYFYHEDRRQFVLNTWSNDVMKECTIANPQTCYELEKTGVWGEAVRQRKPIILNDFEADHPLRKGYPEGHAHLTNFMTVPVFNNDQIVAVVGVANKASDYDEIDVLQLNLFMDAVWKSVDIKKNEEKLRESEERISAITNSANDAITMMDNNGNISYWNPAAQRIFGYTKEEAIGKNLHELIVPERFRPAHLAAFPEFQKTGQGNALGKTLELAARRKDGHEIEVALSLSAVKIKEEWHSVGIIQDITERKKAEDQIKHLATHDLLTDLPSLRLAKDRLSSALNIARRYKKAAAVMFIDLDGFKTVNDTLGHDAGDYVLKEVAQRMISCVRETDTVARVGGDEFLIIATEINAPENASQIAEKVIQVVSRPVIFNGQLAIVGASIGIALFPGDSEDMDQLIKQADEAMYRVKNAGKNGFRFVNSALI